MYRTDFGPSVVCETLARESFPVFWENHIIASIHTFDRPVSLFTKWDINVVLVKELKKEGLLIGCLISI